MKIAPSILAADFNHLGDQIQQAQQGGADQIHIDVMDGRFVPTISFGIPIITAARRATDLPLDVHLMIVDPARHLEAVAQAGADAITIHAEATPHLHRDLEQIKRLGKQAGVALNPHTSPAVLDYIWPVLDIILVMTVNPGAGGQAFLTETLPKIRHIHTLAAQAGHPLDITLDGGINPQTAPQGKNAGASVFVAGSSIFGHPTSIAAAIAALRHSIQPEA